MIGKNIKWNKETYKELINYLVSIKEEKYKLFNLKLITTKYEILGIRIPILRKLAKQISKTDFKPLLDLFNDEYYEVVLLEGLILSYIEDYNEFKSRLLKYVLKVDNWAICDTVINGFKIISKNKELGLDLVKILISSNLEFSKRFGFVILLNFYVSSEYLDVIFKYVKSCDTDDYYVNMAISWLLCECYVKFTSETYNFIKTNKLNDFILRKTISKVNDSYRVSLLDKERLRELKTKC